MHRSLQVGVLLAITALLLACTPATSVAPLPSATVPPTTAPTTGLSTTQPPNPATGRMGAIASMATARAAHSGTLLPSGAVLLAGGFGGLNDVYYASAELYDPIHDQFEATGAMRDPRCAHTATVLPDGTVLIAGGYNGDYLASAEIYDPATGTFTPTAPMTTARSGHVAVLLPNGQVLIAGGVGTGWTFLASAELYDPVTRTFTPTGAMHEARESHTATVLADGRVLIVGGHRGRQAAITIYASAELYDPASGSFAPTGSMTIPRHKHDAVRLANGQVFISGGADERDGDGAYQTTERYDPATGTFSASASMPSVRYKHQGTSVVLADGRVVITGGAQQAVVYDPVRDAFAFVPGQVGSAPVSRLFATATHLAGDAVLLTGGYGVGQRTSAGAWLYTP